MGMKPGWILSAAVTTTLLIFATSLVAQEGEGRARKPIPTGKTPRTADGKPDLSGVWSPEHTFIYDISVSLAEGETLPMQPWAEKLTKERMSKDDPEANCLPTGVPRQAPYPWRIMQSPGLIVFLFEGNIFIAIVKFS